MKFNDFSRRYRTYSADIDRVFKRVLRSGWYILGEELERFESEFASYLNVKHVVGVNSGTDAIYLALRALGIGDGDEVITVANTATPTVSAIRMTGAIPAFVDIDPLTCNLDPSKIEGKISRRTKAILPVHLFGRPFQVAEISAIARKHGLPMVEDVAQAAGATFNGKRVGGFGQASCFSFYPTKTLGGFGDGGAIATNDRGLAARFRQLRNYGERSKYLNASEGINSRLDEIQAALLSWGLSKLDQWNQRRRTLAALYLRHLADTAVQLPPADDESFQSAWHLFVIRHPRRQNLRRHLERNGIQTGIHYPRPIYRQPAYRFLNYSNADLPVTALAMSGVLSLPLNPEMTNREVIDVCRVVREFARP